MYECLSCFDFFKKYHESCPYCGSEAIVCVDEEDPW